MIKNLLVLPLNMIHYLFLKFRNIVFSSNQKLKKKISIMIIAPHQDDEVVGAGGKIIQTIKNGGEVYVIYLTNSFPKNYYNFLGIPKIITLNRRIESKIAMNIAGIPEKNLFFLGYHGGIMEGYKNYPNPELMQIFKNIERDISRLVKQKKPDEVYVPAFEGGHPDHDITNYIVSRIVKKMNIPAYEMPLYPVNYPNYKKGIKYSIYQEFISPKNSFQLHLHSFKIIHLKLTKEEKNKKLSMLKVFRSQNPFLINYMNKVDKFRLLPDYNYLIPPHKGELYIKGNLIGNITFDDFKNTVKFHENRNIKNNKMSLL